MPCYDCGLEYSDDGWIEAIIPDKIWNKIKPDGCEDGCGLLCITCIARRLNKLGMKKAIGIKIEERYCEIAAQRLMQNVLF